jgi:hypothetical protein
MCLRLNRFQILKKRKAKKDIICYKTVTRIYADTFAPRFGYNPSFRYTLGTEANSIIVREGLNIENGLHSYKYFADVKFRQHWRVHTIIRCVIPKGATFYKGISVTDVNYVSDRLIPVEVIND